MFDKEKETLTQQASAECDKVVQTKLDSIRTAKAEEKEDPKKKDK